MPLIIIKKLVTNVLKRDKGPVTHVSESGEGCLSAYPKAQKSSKFLSVCTNSMVEDVT